jgi:pilus assembly protein CpaE
MTISILLVDDSEIMLKLVSKALKADGYELFTASNGKEALELIRSMVPNLVLLDVFLPDTDGYQICKSIRADPHTAQVPIIMLTGFSDLDNRLKAFDSGADDFMQKPFQMEELQARVKVHLRRTSAASLSSAETSKTVSTRCYKTALFSLRGGLGVSTLAVNLSAGLAQLWGLRTLLVDLAFLNGQASLMMDVPLRNTWADLGKHKPEEIEQETLEKVILRHRSGVELLAAPRRVEEAELISEKHVQRIIELAATKFKFLVMDLPHDFSFPTLAALDSADTILLVTASDLASVHCASNALNTFKDLGYRQDKVQLVLNATYPTTGLARKEIEKVLQKQVTVMVPNMPNTILNAITLGKPVVLETDKPEAAYFEDLAFFWSPDDYKKNDPANPSSAWQRVMERAKRRRQQTPSKA